MNEIKQLLKSEEPVKWLFYGDSITHGVFHTFGLRDYTELFAERVRAELGRVMDVVINTAISGNTTRQLLAGFEWRVAQFKPDVVFLMIGMNDCSEVAGITPEEFEQNLTTLKQRIRAIGSLLVLQTTCPILPGTAPEREPRFEEFMNTIRRVASKHKLPLIDHTKFWLEHKDSHFYWMSNAFHPNELGHRAFALHLYQALGIYDSNSTSCKLFIPQ